MSSLIARISSDLLVPQSYVNFIARSAPHRYKVYSIAKRGGKGFRTIAQPAREVKRLQRWIVGNVLIEATVHQAVTAYEKGSSIRKNAMHHAEKSFLLKMDFADFFPSIKADDFLQFAELNLLSMVEENDLELLARILFWQPKREEGLRLSIGAPSSPKVSNLLLYEFDTRISEVCDKIGVTYTRYADDLTFSMATKEARVQVEDEVMRILEEIPWPRLRINAGKTFYGSKACRRRVTGLILTNDGNVSLGRDRKRLLRAQVHRFYVLGEHGSMNEEKLKGMIAFARSIEPEFIQKLEDHYDLSL